MIIGDKEVFISEIRTIDDAFRCKELWDLDNLLTLCYECHKDIHRSNK